MPAADDDHESGTGAEAEGRALMADGAQRLLAGVHAGARAWVEAAVARVLDAWGALDEPARAEAATAAAAAGDRAATRVDNELRALFDAEPAAQRATPLEVIRTLRREATEVLRGAGVPEVVRDPYESRAFPDDVYGIVLRTPADLGDEDLGGALLAWGLGKAKFLRACNNRDSAP